MTSREVQPAKSNPYTAKRSNVQRLTFKRQVSQRRTLGTGTFLLILLALLSCGQAAPSFRGTELNPPQPIANFTLTDQHGQPFTLSEQRGQVILRYFGYTLCPDVCPTTLGVWKQVRAGLDDDTQRVRFAFVTVDPERDTAERMQQYMRVFSPDFMGLSGTTAELESVYQSFGVFYEKEAAPDSAMGYLVTHTSSTFVVDTAGNWRLKYSYGTPAEDILHDIQQLLEE
jgi:protein SCO1/2